jgi:hypothetical protein
MKLAVAFLVASVKAQADSDDNPKFLEGTSCNSDLPGLGCAEGLACGLVEKLSDCDSECKADLDKEAAELLAEA